MIVAIDGPAGAGKSAVARAVARTLGLRYLDTGALYRVVALAALERAVSLDDAAGLAALARNVGIEMDGGAILLDGRDVTGRIRDPDVTRAVSRVAAHPGVRSELVPLQRQAADDGDVVMEGRDIGSVVIPTADVKVFLTASLRERSRRRSRQLGLPEDEETLERMAAEIRARDEADARRSVSPLVKAPGAIEIDTTAVPFEEVVDRVVAAARAARAEHSGGGPAS